MILSNQVECLKCGDKPFSAHRHDFKYCKCEKVAVDGGMDYLKRMGNLNGVREMSIHMDDDLVVKLRECMTDKQNSLGKVCAIVRTLRDNGYEISAIEERR